MGWRKHVQALLVAIGIAAAAGPARALEPSSTGVVVLHGKWGNNGQMGPLTEALKEAGFLVERPEMPWSGHRLFDRGFDSALDEIEAATKRLRAQGATRIVVAGHSLGGNAALAYSASGKPLAALVLFAPAHFPEGRSFLEQAADSVAKARTMVAAGEGDDNATFISLNDGNRSRSIRAKASDYLTYYAPDGAAAMSLFAPMVGTAPILWVAGTLDRTTKTFALLVHPRLPTGTPLEKHEIVASHMDAPDIGRDKTVEWLKALP